MSSGWFKPQGSIAHADGPMAISAEDAGWTYSREHGAPFTGLGLGLPRARVYARFMGGGTAVISQPGGGCDALAWWDAAGEGEDWVGMGLPRSG